jgi:hypothetical protein
MILIAAGIGEFRSPASACFPVGTVVIPGDGAGDQPVESPEVNVLSILSADGATARSPPLLWGKPGRGIAPEISRGSG